MQGSGGTNWFAVPGEAWGPRGELGAPQSSPHVSLLLRVFDGSLSVLLTMNVKGISHRCAFPPVFSVDSLRSVGLGGHGGSSRSIHALGLWRWTLEGQLCWLSSVLIPLEAGSGCWVRKAKYTQMGPP